MRRFINLLLTIVILVFAFPTTTLANEANRTPNTVTLSADDEVNEDYFAAGDVVEIFGTVNGDAYVAGGQVIVDGTINGDLLVAGGTVNISGTVTQDVRAVGGEIDITGEVGRNVSFGAGDVTIGGAAYIAGSIAGAAGNVLISSPVDGDIRVASGNLTISEAVGGDIKAGTDQLRITSQARVEGDVTYWSPLDASIEYTASISGTVTKRQGIQNYDRQMNQKRAFDSGYWIYWILTSLVVGLILTHLLPKAMTTSSEILAKRPWKSLLIGFGVLILMPLASVLVMVTVVGIPVGIISLLTYGIALYLAKFVSMVCAGNWVLQKTNKGKSSLKMMFAVGLLIFAVLKLVPILSFIAGLSFLLFGLGAMALSTNAYLAKNRK